MKLSPIQSNMTELSLADGTQVLFSYQTPVACITDGEFFSTAHKWSNTTTRHVNKWREKNNFPSRMTTSKPQLFFDNLVKGV